MRVIIVSLILIISYSCSKKDKIIYEPIKREDPYITYNQAKEAFDKNDFFFASKKFTEAELNFEEVDFAAKSALMSAYSLYSINFYNEALENLERYIKIYPSDKNVIYAHFLIAVIYFEQISDEKNDLAPTINAYEKINFFLEKYPDTDYAIDLKFKKDLVENQLAAKEMYLARYYISVKKWIPAINRLKNILKDYDKTIFIEEALFRLIEINYHIGLEEEANKYATILGYNYNSSEWFEQSYKILNKDYKIKIKDKKNKKKNGLIKKIIGMVK